MNVVRVDSTADERLAGYALLGDERALRDRGWFVAEGRFVVERLIAGRRHDILSLLVNDAALAALAPIASGLSATPIYVCAPRFFESLTGHHFHRGCLALAKRPAATAAFELARGARSLLLLDRVGNPDNIGSIFRSGLALGVDAIWLGPGCADHLGRKALRTSMAAALALPCAVFGPGDLWLAEVARLPALGFALLALSPHPPGTDLRELSRGGGPERFALLLGAEGDGLAPELEALAARRLQIAMRAGVDSLNVGVAAGIALHALLGP